MQVTVIGSSVAIIPQRGLREVKGRLLLSKSPNLSILSAYFALLLEYSGLLGEYCVARAARHISIATAKVRKKEMQNNTFPRLFSINLKIIWSRVGASARRRVISKIECAAPSIISYI